MSSNLNKKLILQAINVLKEINEKHYEDSSKKKQLLEDEGEKALYLQVNLKKIPKFKNIKMIKVKLPHSLLKDTHEVCLITGDTDKNNRKAEIEPDIFHYKALLDKHGVTQISQVITLRQLRTEYKPYEAKQKLLGAFDFFISDGKISHCLPRVLGRHFFKKRKFPVQINLKTQNLKQQIEKALSTKVFYITGLGNTCTSEVAYLDMSDSEIIDNIKAMAQELQKKLTGSWGNVMGIYLKTAKSKAIPIYISYDDITDVKTKRARKKEKNSAMVENNTNSIKRKGEKDKKDSIQNAEVNDTTEKEKTTETKKNTFDLIESSVDSIKRKSKKSKTNSFKNTEVNNVTVKEKTTEAKKNTFDLIESSVDSIKRKSKKSKTNSFKNTEVNDVTVKEKTTETKKNTFDLIESSVDSIKRKSKKSKTNSFENTEANNVTVKDEISQEQKKAPIKRKRGIMESIAQNSDELNENETPVKITKKRKIEGINMQRYQSRKEARKSNKKKNGKIKQSQ